jgi:hypothetical protein
VDQARLEQALHDRIAGRDGLLKFLQGRAEAAFCGPVLLGESSTPIGARRIFPALKLTLGPLPAAVRVVGSQAFVWRSDEALDLLVVTTSRSDMVPANALSGHMLDPLLFYLALKAGTETGPDEVSSAAWLEERDFRLHIAHEGGIATFTYLASDISPEQARVYLAELVCDFLDRGSFDLLPFDLAVSDEGLRLPLVKTDYEILQVYRALPATEGEEAKRLRKSLGMDEEEEADPGRSDEEILAGFRARYPECYQEAIEADEEKEDHRVYWPMKLMRIVEAEVPADAWDKMRRRFRLLDQGPARVRSGQATRSRRGKGGRRG